MSTYDPAFFDDLRGVQERHFWFRTRRRVIGAVAATLLPPVNARVLEVGCGCGGVLPVFSELRPKATVVGLDLYHDALTRCDVRCSRVQGDVAALPFGPAFDMVGCFDVLEHLDDDVGVAKDIGRAIRPGGRFLVTVPASPALWSAFDEAAMHRRRYTEPRLRSMLEAAGYEVEFVSPFMSTTYVLLWLQRRIASRSSGRQAVRDGLRIIPGLNRVLDWSLRWEPSRLSGRKHLPFGSSLLAIARIAGAQRADS